MQRNALLAALDVFLGRNTTADVMRQLNASIARARVAEPHPRRSRVGHQELEAMMSQLAHNHRRT